MKEHDIYMTQLFVLPRLRQPLYFTEWLSEAFLQGQVWTKKEGQQATSVEIQKDTQGTGLRGSSQQFFTLPMFYVL